MRRSFLYAVLFLAAVVNASAASPPKGHLVIIGGGSHTEQIMQTFVRLAGGRNASVVVFPMASGDAEGTGREQRDELLGDSVAHCISLNLTREQANSDSIVRLLDRTTGVFFSGGDQSLLTAALKGTRVEQRLHEIYRQGGVIGGTSAGAAVMSEIMITGDELLNKDTINAFISIRKNNIKTTPGFGFVTTAIVDQHFVKRKRHNRLISVVLEHPSLLGIGIDESTAIIVNPNNTFTVAGESLVFVYDASRANAVGLNNKGTLSGSPLALHILQAGEIFNFKTRRVVTVRP